MACAVQTKPSKTVNEQWQSLFSCNYTTLEGSCLFIKKLIAIAVSNVTYARSIFPEEAYGNRYLAGIKLKILSEGSDCEAASKIINLIKGCYDAVEKKYLQQLKIGICANPTNIDEAIEAFNFHFDYHDDTTSKTSKEKSFQNSENDAVVSSTINLLKNIYFINGKLGDLPSNSFLTLKLLYNDDITPSDYEPPGFQPASNAKFAFNGESINIMLGKVATPYHNCKLVVKTIQKKIPVEAIVTEDPLQQNESFAYEVSNPGEDASDAALAEMLDDSNVYANGNKKHNSPQSSPGDNCETIKQIKCPCNRKNYTNYSTIQCCSCLNNQHQICYGFLSSNEIPGYFSCVKCVRSNRGKNTQKDRLYVISEPEQEALCVIRQALFLCATLPNVTVTTLRTNLDVKHTLAKALLQRLKEEGYIKIGIKKNVDKELIVSRGFKQYFNVVHDQGMEDKENSPGNLNQSMNNLTMGNSSMQENLNHTPNTRSSKRKKPKNQDLSEDDMEDFSQNSRKRSRKASVNKKNK